jgi:hypothetical protein
MHNSAATSVRLTGGLYIRLGLGYRSRRKAVSRLAGAVNHLGRGLGQLLCPLTQPDPQLGDRLLDLDPPVAVERRKRADTPARP